MNELLTSLAFWQFTIPFVGAVVAWFSNEWRKHEWEQYQRKDASYRELVRSLRAFYEGEQDQELLRREFLDQLNLCWLYCPDDVIKRGYQFLETVHTNQVQSDEMKEGALGNFIASIRKDALSRKLVRRTAFTGSDFRHLGPSQSGTT